MVSLRSLFAAGALCLSAANAHFELRQPPSLEGDNMNEDLEPNAPCGGGVADLSTNKVVDFHVDGDAVAWFLGHPQAKWLIRGTLDSKAAGNWTEMYPIIQQDGRGEYCQPAVTAPKAWAGKKGIISVACGAPDGLLFQVSSHSSRPSLILLTIAVCRCQLRLGRQYLPQLLQQRVCQRQLQRGPEPHRPPGRLNHNQPGSSRVDLGERSAFPDSARQRPVDWGPCRHRSNASSRGSGPVSIL